MWLQAIDLALADVAEVAVVGDPDAEATRGLLAVAAGAYTPTRVVAAGPGDGRTEVPLLRNRPLRDGRPTAYVCRAFACREPVTDADALAAQLAEHAATV
jgi:uncharacterized protein YyaL (SSP411 family)